VPYLLKPLDDELLLAAIRSVSALPAGDAGLDA
jgi:hypothetical protein